MQLNRALLTLALSLPIGALPAFADTFVIFPQPTAPYTTGTTNYGGGDGSFNSINSLGIFTFSGFASERQVPNGWATWNSPPAVESSTPNVLFASGSPTFTLTVGGSNNTVGFELEPDAFQLENVAVSFFNQHGILINTLTLSPSGSAGALLFALQDTTPGATIGSVVINDLAGDDFAFGQLRAGSINAASPVPEPSSLMLLGTGMAATMGMARRRIRHMLS